MAKKKTNKEFYEKVKTRTGITEEYIHEFDYRIVSNRMLKKRKKISDFVYETNKPKSIEDVEKILTKLDSFGGRVTLEKAIFCYGIEEGTKMFDLYRNKQAETITFEYKKDKYGWTEEDFSKYNKSRSVTLENMIKRHGEIDGKAKFDEYCEKQAVNGNTLEYFVSKYGKKDGNKQYEKVCANKSHTYDNYVRLYGEENAEEKLTKFHKGCNGFYSIISQQFFEELTKKI